MSHELVEPPALEKGLHEPAGQGPKDVGVANFLAATRQGGPCPRS